MIKIENIVIIVAIIVAAYGWLYCMLGANNERK